MTGQVEIVSQALLRGYVRLGGLRLQSPQSGFLVLVDENG